MKKKSKLLLSLLIATCISIHSMKAQETTENPLDTLTRSVQNIVDELSKSKRLKITGYIQPQWQIIDSAGAPSFAGGDFSSKNKAGDISSYNNRLMMRRGRFKFTYEYGNAEYMLNTDVTEKGLAMRETYLRIYDPWLHMFSITAGLLQNQFGFELNQSSSIRETPERARYNQTLFPTERDLGVFGRMQFPKTSTLSGLILDIAVMNGSAGVAPEFDSHKDMTGRLAYGKTTSNEKMAFAIGTSYYYGGYRQGVRNEYNFMINNGLNSFNKTADTSIYDQVARRLYLGIDAQVTFDWPYGMTTIRAEYIQGQQPGTDKSSKSIGEAYEKSFTSSIYHRNFNGAYFYFIQNIGQSKFQVVLKYDWYDPNLKIAGQDIGKTGTNTKVGDIRFDTYGFGANYRLHSNVKLMLYYDWVINEQTLIAGYKNDIKDNVSTIRMQYKF